MSQHWSLEHLIACTEREIARRRVARAAVDEQSQMQAIGHVLLGCRDMRDQYRTMRTKEQFERELQEPIVDTVDLESARLVPRQADLFGGH